MRSRRFFFAAAAVAAANIALLALGMAPALGGSATVETQDFKFVSDAVTVKVGDSITFKNTGQAPHTATAKDKSFDTGNINVGESKTVTVSKAGTIAFVCIYHESMGMVGTINVEAAAAASPAAARSAAPASPKAAATVAAAASPSAAASPQAGGFNVDAPFSKVFRYAAAAMALLAFLAAGAGYVRVAMRSPDRR